MRNRSAGKSYKMATGGTESADDEFSVQVVMRRPQRAHTQAGPVGGGIFNSLQRRKKSTRTGGPCKENNIIGLFLILIWAGKRRGCGLPISHIPASAGSLKLFEPILSNFWNPLSGFDPLLFQQISQLPCKVWSKMAKTVLKSLKNWHSQTLRWICSFS